MIPVIAVAKDDLLQKLSNIGVFTQDGKPSTPQSLVFYHEDLVSNLPQHVFFGPVGTYWFAVAAYQTLLAGIDALGDQTPSSDVTFSVALTQTTPKSLKITASYNNNTVTKEIPMDPLPNWLDPSNIENFVKTNVFSVVNNVLKQSNSNATRLSMLFSSLFASLDDVKKVVDVDNVSSDVVILYDPAQQYYIAKVTRDADLLSVYIDTTNNTTNFDEFETAVMFYGEGVQRILKIRAKVRGTMRATLVPDHSTEASVGFASPHNALITFYPYTTVSGEYNFVNDEFVAYAVLAKQNVGNVALGAQVVY